MADIDIGMEMIANLQQEVKDLRGSVVQLALALKALTETTKEHVIQLSKAIDEKC